MRLPVEFILDRTDGNAGFAAHEFQELCAFGLRVLVGHFCLQFATADNPQSFTETGPGNRAKLQKDPS